MSSFERIQGRELLADDGYVGTRKFQEDIDLGLGVVSVLCPHSDIHPMPRSWVWA